MDIANPLNLPFSRDIDLTGAVPSFGAPIGTGLEKPTDLSDEEGGSGSTIFYAKITWVDPHYTFAEVEWDGTADDGTWATKSGGATGQAFEESGLTDLPDNMVVRMEAQVDDAAASQYIFRMATNPITGLTPFSVDATNSGESATVWDIEGKTDLGCHFTVQGRVFYNSADHKWKMAPRIVYISGDGRWLGVSAEGTAVDVLTLTSVEVLTNVAVSGTNFVKYTKTIYVAEASSETGPTTWHEGAACP